MADADEARLIEQDSERHMDPAISATSTAASWTLELPVHPRTSSAAAQSIDERPHLGPQHASLDISTAEEPTPSPHQNPKLYVGDWQCSYCDWWNNKHHKFCRGKRIGNPCSTMRRPGDSTQADDGKHRKRKQGRFVGDWFCGGCDEWNSKENKRCFKCKERVDMVKEDERLE